MPLAETTSSFLTRVPRALVSHQLALDVEPQQGFAPRSDGFKIARRLRSDRREPLPLSDLT